MRRLYNEDALRAFHPGGATPRAPVKTLQELESELLEIAMEMGLSQHSSDSHIGDLALRILIRRAQ